MKVLDAESLHTGIDETKQEIHHFQSQITSIQKAVRGITTLHESLKGKGGEAIRAFYNECHQPFLIYMYNFLIDYEEILDQMKRAVLSYEPETNGMIRQDFLENDVTSGLEKVKNVTTGLTDEANSVMDSVQDIVALPKLDDEEFLHHVQRGKKRTKETVEQLHDLDNSQTKALGSIEDQLRTMKDYIIDIQSVFTNGEITLHNIDRHTVASIGFYQNMLADTPVTYAALRKQNQFNRVAGPYVMMMYPNMLFPITYRNHSAGNVHPGDISKQKPIKEVAEQNRLTDPESIAIANYLRREYTDEPEIDVQEMESEANVESPPSSEEIYYTAREPLTFWHTQEVAGGYSDLAGDPFMMGHIATAGFNFAFEDIGTVIDPDSTAEDRLMAGLFLFGKPVKLVGKGAEAFKAGDKVRDARKVDRGTGKSPSDFADRAKLEGHFDKHGKEFGGLYKNADEYLKGAKKVINNGIKVKYEYKGEIRTGYVKFMGNNKNGKAKFEFVGTNNNGDITTYHTQSGKKIWKTINGENIPVINPAE
ncbi:ribonuclease YeeF family protein [Virgibacillus sp. FSP13]